MFFPEQIFNIMVIKDGADDLRSKLRCFIIFLLFHLAIRDCFQFIDTAALWKILTTILFLVIMICVLFNFYTKTVLYIALSVLTVKMFYHFPFNSNHLIIEFIALIFIITCANRSNDHDKLLCQMLRWVLFIILFFSGIQKILYGTYFNGTYFIYMARSTPSTHWFFGLFLPIEQIKALKPSDILLIKSPILMVISNGVYVLEILGSLLLLFPKCLKIAICTIFGVIVGIEMVAQEFLFGCLFLNLLLLHIPGDWNKRCLPLFIIFYFILFVIKILQPENIIN